MAKTKCRNTPDLFTKTNAQRQQEYRQRQKDKKGVRLDMYIENDVHTMLERLAEYDSRSMKVIIAAIIKQEYYAKLKKDTEFKKFRDDKIMED